MGGIGSGRLGWRRKTDEFRSLDANWLGRSGRLDAGYRGGLHWPWDGGEICYVDLTASADALHIDLLVGGDGVGWASASHVVPIIWIRCAKGGSRPLFRCPDGRAGQPCGRRAIKLYVAGPRIACRTCLNLSYSSQSEPPDERLLRKARRLRERLGEREWRGLGHALPPRPRGMHSATHDRLVEQLAEIEDKICALGAARLGLEFT